MIKILASISVVFCLFFLEQGGAQDTANSFAHNKGNQFEYSQDDIPEICFFPTEKARWDGYKVTNNNWNQLTDFQKFTFVSEAIAEIHRNEHLNIDLKDGDSILLVQGLNQATVKSHERGGEQVEFPIIKLLRDSLKDADRIKAR